LLHNATFDVDAVELAERVDDFLRDA
jgi:hypothetical protein